MSPITGELVPIGEMAEHMRISLIDPKYREQKEAMMAKIRDTTKGAHVGGGGYGVGWGGLGMSGPDNKGCSSQLRRYSAQPDLQC